MTDFELEIKNVLTDIGGIATNNALVQSRKSSQFPVVDVTSVVKHYAKAANCNHYNVSETIRITAQVVKKVAEDYRTELNNLTTLIVNTLLTNEDFNQLFEEISQVVINKEYNLDGDMAIGQSIINFEIKYHENFLLDVQTDLTTTTFGIDMYDHFDKNIANIGPDGKIDVEFEIKLQV